MSYREFNRKNLFFRKLRERHNKLTIEESIVDPRNKPANLSKEACDIISETAYKIKEARRNGKPVVLAFGAHVIKNGLAKVLIELAEKGFVTHFAGNGAVSIHDWEFAYQGQTSEDVRENVAKGCFGIWDETGRYINLALIAGAYHGYGYGEAVGRMISEEGLEIPGMALLEKELLNLYKTNRNKAAAAIDLIETILNENLNPGFMKIPHPWKQYSLQAAAFAMKIPFTIHPMIGHDIIYTHPVNHGAAVGRTAMTDFLRFTHTISNIDHGVYISVGSAVMSPMIFEKALSMAQNIAIQQNLHIDNHFIVIADLAPVNWNWLKDGEPPPNNPAYYMRYNKTFSRMGGLMRYVAADNRDFLLELLHDLD